jgi:tetratricopeptide (TPR) repeat protein
MKWIIYIVSVVFVAGCTTTKQQVSVQLPGEDPRQTVAPDKNTSSAVISLLEKARDATQQGDYQRAEVLLERTVRIEPRNASLWHYLAKLRLQQTRYNEAIGLAQKSNNLARSNDHLKADNWRIIAHAKYQMGDVNGAQDAQAKARTLAAD